ncbi:MAG: multidrug DMT transporter permease [Methylotenera sp.]|nr:MAG: multidrug DMT transporter permease [Methylotenera sp.]
MNTLNLQQAAVFLKIHPVTLGDKARTGEIPGAKIGKCWVFVDIDLISYIRAQYKWRDLQGEKVEVLQCHSSNGKDPLIGGSKSPTTVEQYRKALELPTKPKLQSITTS